MSSFPLLPDNLATAPEVQEREKRIVFGSAVAAGEYPWAVRLVKSYAPRSRFCSGFLILPDWIATAWHCTVDSSQDDRELEPSEQRYAVFGLDGNARPRKRITRIIRHPLA